MTANPWIVRQAGAERRMRLFCFPYAGGNAAGYLEWQAAMPQEIDVCAVQLPGRGRRFHEAPFTSMAPLADVLAGVIAAQDGLPYALFGHSLGGLLAFEVARRLRARGAPSPVHLILSGVGAPRRRQAARGLHTMPDAGLLAELERYNGTPREVLGNRDLMDLLLPTIRADFALVETYRFEPAAPLDVPMTVLAGDRDPVVSRWQAQGWRDETCNAFHLEIVDGDHFFIHTQREAVTARIARLLTTSARQPETST